MNPTFAQQEARKMQQGQMGRPNPDSKKQVSRMMFTSLILPQPTQPLPAPNFAANHDKNKPFTPNGWQPKLQNQIFRPPQNTAYQPMPPANNFNMTTTGPSFDMNSQGIGAPHPRFTSNLMQNPRQFVQQKQESFNPTDRSNFHQLKFTKTVTQPIEFKKLTPQQRQSEINNIRQAAQQFNQKMQQNSLKSKEIHTKLETGNFTMRPPKGRIAQSVIISTQVRPNAPSIFDVYNATKGGNVSTEYEVDESIQNSDTISRRKGSFEEKATNQYQFPQAASPFSKYAATKNKTSNTSSPPGAESASLQRCQTLPSGHKIGIDPIIYAAKLANHQNSMPSTAGGMSAPVRDVTSTDQQFKAAQTVDQPLKGSQPVWVSKSPSSSLNEVTSSPVQMKSRAPLSPQAPPMKQNILHAKVSPPKHSLNQFSQGTKSNAVETPLLLKLLAEKEAAQKAAKLSTQQPISQFSQQSTNDSQKGQGAMFKRKKQQPVVLDTKSMLAVKSEAINQLKNIGDSPNQENKYSPGQSRQSVTGELRQFKKEDFLIGKTMGKGQFGEVMLVQHKLTRFICGMKIMSKKQIKGDNYQNQIARELAIQFYLNHRNIAPLYGFFCDADHMYLLVEFCPEGQLLNKLRKANRMEEHQVSPIIRQISEGIQYIHTELVIHRDIKPQNMLFIHDCVKISDFGWAVYKGHGTRKTISGSPLYYSPEIVKGVSYDEKIDIWCIGMMTYECLLGKIPFRIYSELDLNRIVEDQIKFPEYVDTTEQTRDFILRTMKKDPAERMDLKEILQHPFITKYPPKLPPPEMMNDFKKVLG